MKKSFGQHLLSDRNYLKKILDELNLKKDKSILEIGSTKAEIRVEICSACHPFYTGTQKILDSEGRVDRFQKRYGKKK